MNKYMALSISFLFIFNFQSQLNIVSTTDNLKLVGRIKILGEVNSSLIFFKDKNKYLLSFRNRVYDYKYESFWMNEQSKVELYDLINNELPKKEKNKTVEILLEDKRILSIEMHKKSASLNIWDGYKWYKTSWYKLKEIEKLFNKDKGRVYAKADGLIYVE